MVNIAILAQMIDSMSEAVEKLEKAKQENNINEFNKLKVFIFDLYRQINQAMLK